MINQELVGLEDALREAAEDGLRFKAALMRNRGVELTIIFPEPIVKVNASVKKRRKLNFQVIHQSHEDPMRDRIRKRLYVPVPSSFVAGRYSDAERLLRTGNLATRFLVEYNELSEEYALRASAAPSWRYRALRRVYPAVLAVGMAAEMGRHFARKYLECLQF